MTATIVGPESGGLYAEPGTTTGLIKLKLVHARGFSVLLPDLLAADIGGWKWFQPKFFTACMMAFLDGRSVGTLWVDLAEQGPKLCVRFSSDHFVRRFDDGAQLFRCAISGPSDLASFATGTCILGDDHDVLLNLFHHTIDQARDAIRQSKQFRASPWNVQGTKKLENVGYAYFTSIPAIESDADLRRIAMASDGEIDLRPTNASVNDAVRIKVYRESTTNRTATLNIVVPASVIASQHVYRHAPHGDPVYFEVCHPEIFRVGLVPGAVLPIVGDSTLPAAGSLKSFDYVVLGDADTVEGLEAPYDEEHTQELFLVERCEGESIFDFWKRNANSDRRQGREFERMKFQPSLGLRTVSGG